MCRVRTVDYQPAPEHVREARHWLERLLRRWELQAQIPDAALLATELVTNAIVHAQSPVHVTAAVADGVLEVAVGDHDRHAPRVRRSSEPGSALTEALVRDRGLLSEGGRGLPLADAMADEWGIAIINGGKQMWYRLSIDRAWAYRTACPCAGTDLDRVRLESGRYALAVAGPWDE